MSEAGTDPNRALFINSIKFLHTLSETVPSNLYCLKSFYASKFRILEKAGQAFIPDSKKKSESRCQSCCLKLSDVEASCSIRKEFKKTKFGRQIIRKRFDEKCLTRYQSRYFTRLKEKSENYAVMSCGFCTNENIFPMAKPPKTKRIINNNEVNRKSKKNKRKDKTCGLNKSILKSVQEPKSVFLTIEVSPKRNNEIEQSKKNSENTRIVPNNLQIKKKNKAKNVNSSQNINKINSESISKSKANKQKKKQKGHLQKVLQAVMEPKKKVSTKLSDFLTSIK